MTEKFINNLLNYLMFNADIVHTVTNPTNTYEMVNAVTIPDLEAALHNVSLEDLMEGDF